MEPTIWTKDASGRAVLLQRGTPTMKGAGMPEGSSVGFNTVKRTAQVPLLAGTGQQSQLGGGISRMDVLLGRLPEQFRSGFIPIGPSGAAGLLTGGAGKAPGLLSRLAAFARTPRGAATMIGGGLAAGLGAAELGTSDVDILGTPAWEMFQRGGAGSLMGPGLPVMDGRIPGDWIAYSWDTGTATFYRLIDGRIAVQRRNGIWKVYRPQKHIVVPRNPRIGTLIRADKRVGRMLNSLKKRIGRKR